ncbi:MAG: AAA family ATPase [Candidatus Nanoarchaeia archaeon]|nr:AAA family ATPase [Candidatus Nanoarchaeia archaeon]
MKILVTGTPGTGKTSIAIELSKLLKLIYVDVKKNINEHKETIDKIEDGELIINSKLKKILEKELPDNCVFETHLIEYCPLADCYVILRTKPGVLKKRLSARNYSLQKIRDNLEVEILDYFTQAIKSNKIIEYDSSKGSAKLNAKKIMELILKKKYNKGEIKYSDNEIKKNLI